jgi:2-isopropylmalate synthase
VVTLYDTTLRDGTQREGLSLSVEDKLRIAAKLDLLGVHYIEGGFPGSNPKDIEFFERLGELELEQAVITAFGATCRKDTPAEDDMGLDSLIATGCKALCIFGKAWDIHVTETLQTTLEENVRMVHDSVAYLKTQVETVFFDAEHFFDGYKANRDYALQVVQAAAEARADCVVLCDTNGGTMPHEVAAIIAELSELVDVPLGMHAHNDGGCAVANSLVAAHAGAVHVQGTINGYGERAGNADLISIIPGLVLKMGEPAISAEQLRLLTEVSHFVAETANVSPNPFHPYVGTSAFAHKGGVHASAAARLSEAYEHIDPGAVGNHARVVVSELAGRASLTMKAAELGINLSTDQAHVTAALDEIKELEHRGYSFEAADGSLSIMLKKRLGIHKPPFELVRYRVIVEKLEDGRVTSEASVKVRVNGQEYLAAAEGDGPVNALDKALRVTVGQFLPGALADIELVDYKVRLLEGKHEGTGAGTRVLIESTNGETSWGTVGVSENIIEASWEALVDSIDYGLSGGGT